jgi:hypothetical protein
MPPVPIVTKFCADAGRLVKAAATLQTNALANLRKGLAI